MWFITKPEQTTRRLTRRQPGSAFLLCVLIHPFLRGWRGDLSLQTVNTCLRISVSTTRCLSVTVSFWLFIPAHCFADFLFLEMLHLLLFQSVNLLLYGKKSRPIIKFVNIPQVISFYVWVRIIWLCHILLSCCAVPFLCLQSDNEENNFNPLYLSQDRPFPVIVLSAQVDTGGLCHENSAETRII